MRGMEKPEIGARQREELTTALKTAKSKEEYQRALCLWPRADQAMGSRQIAKMLGMSFGGVRNIHSKYLRKGAKILTNVPIGGRLESLIYSRAASDMMSFFLKQISDAFTDESVVIFMDKAA